MRERAHRAISGANGADESERSDGPNERGVRSEGWMERMERVAPPFRCLLSSSSCRRAGGGVKMWNLCLRRTLLAPTNIFLNFSRLFDFSTYSIFSLPAKGWFSRTPQGGVNLQRCVYKSVPLRQPSQNVGGVDDHRTSRSAR